MSRRSFSFGNPISILNSSIAGRSNALSMRYCFFSTHKQTIEEIKKHGGCMEYGGGGVDVFGEGYTYVKLTTMTGLKYNRSVSERETLC